MAKGSAGDIATLGVAAIAIYFIYGLIKGNGAAATTTNPLQSAVDAAILASRTDVTPSPSPTGDIPLIPMPSLSQTQTIDPSQTGFQIPTILPSPSVNMQTNLQHSPGAIASDAVSTAESLWGDVQAAGLPF